MEDGSVSIINVKDKNNIYSFTNYIDLNDYGKSVLYKNGYIFTGSDRKGLMVYSDFDNN